VFSSSLVPNLTYLDTFRISQNFWSAVLTDDLRWFVSSWPWYSTRRFANYCARHDTNSQELATSQAISTSKTIWETKPCFAWRIWPYPGEPPVAKAGGYIYQLSHVPYWCAVKQLLTHSLYPTALTLSCNPNSRPTNGCIF